MIIICIVWLIIMIILAFTSIKFVGQSEVWVIERLGRYDRTAIAGMLVLMPFVDRVKAKYKLSDMVEVISKEGTSSDGKDVVIDGMVTFKIVDPVAATYNARNAASSVRYVFEYASLIACQGMMVSEFSNNKKEIKEKILEEVKANTANWGVEIVDIAVNFSPMV